MKKRLAQIVSILLILSMLSTCVYATEYNTANDNASAEPMEQSEVSAQNVVLAKPVITKISASGTAVTVTFDVVEGAGKYIVAYEVGGIETQKESLENTVNVLDLEYETTYNFKVKAISDSEGNIVESEWSDISSVTTGIVSLKKPTLSLAAYNKGAILSWKKIPNATSYEIWRYYNKKWSKIKTVSSKTLKYKNTGLKLNKKYYYKVRAVRSVNGDKRTSSFSTSKSIKAKEYLTSTTIKMGYSTGRVWKSAKKYKAGSNKKLLNNSRVAVGTKVTVLKKKYVGGNSMAYVKLSNGKKYWIKSFNIVFNAPYTTKDYTTQVKENFVNKKKYSSKTKYLLFISHYTQRVYLFKGKKGHWDLQKTFRCATGKAITRTPQGVYKLYKKAKRTPAGSKYVSYFKSWNAFHARPFGSKTMGKPASNGCIRLHDENAIYIYKKIPKGTTVVSY